MLLLILCALLLAVDASPDDSFIILAPNVFHVGVREKVFVQMGRNHLNKNYNIYLKEGISNRPMSEIKVVNGGQEENGVLVELMVDQGLLSALERRPTSLQLVAESSPRDRHATWVWLSPHRGYIFIQTNQPVYKPMDTVKFRIFTLDHTFRPWTERFQLSVYNAAGHRVMNTLYNQKEVLFAKHFVIPDVAKTGTWKMTAHYVGDAANAVSTEFKVQKFVMPTFEVNIQMENKYVLVTETELTLTLSARYSYANSVNGAYHCQFGVIKRGSKAKPVYIRGMEQAGSVKDGDAWLSVNVTKLNTLVENQLMRTLSDIAQHGEMLYLGVFVTDIQNGEIQEQQLSIPVVTHKYKIDLSRTHSHFIPGFPVDVAMLVRLPDGSPAEKIPVKITLMEETEHRRTDQQGAVFHTFNINSANSMTLTVTAEDTTQTKDLHPTVSRTGSYLQLSVDYKEYSVGQSLRVIFNTKNAPSGNTGHIHYLVLSRGSIVQKGHLQLAKQSILTLHISENMVPSFRLIGYFYTQNNDIISDSVWLTVKGNCEEKVKVELQGNFKPGGLSKIDIDLKGREAKVALLAVDTALYGLKADNKLTPEQVYSSMEAYDLGCSYGGGANPESVMADAGLAFFTKTSTMWRKDLHCNSTTRHKRSVDLEQEMMALKAKYENETLQSCCAQGFLLLPMQRTCAERAERVSKMQSDPNCTEAFRSCCEEGQRLRKQKTREDAAKGLGRTSSLSAIQEYFLNYDNVYIRRRFQSSFAFESFTVNGKKSHAISLPDSITTWEIQVVTLSQESGLCVTNPYPLRVFKPVFVSLRFPYAVRKYEQMYISPVIYNYATADLHLAVHMEQSAGLCSPGSATTASFVNITVSAGSSQTVIFSAVPMKSGSIPIRIRLYDIDRENEIDAIEKTLRVWTEGVEKTEEATILIHLNETNEVTRTINGHLPDDTVPDSTSTIFVTMEESGFGPSHVKNLLAVSVPKLTIQPYHCLEQTTSRLVPTAIAVHYLDMSNQWMNMPPGARDEALENIQNGVNRIVQIANTNKGGRGGYGSWPNMRPSTWLTSHVVKVLSLLSKRQLFIFGQEGRKAMNVPVSEITEAVAYLRSKQIAADGSFGEHQGVLHRDIGGEDRKAFITAFVTLALTQSVELLESQDRDATETVISKATSYLWSNFDQLTHPFAVAITAYALSVHKNYIQQVRDRIDWAQFEATDGSATAVGTAAYALLAAVTLRERQQAHKFAHWLTTQENSLGGFHSTQDTVMALEALAEYELMEPVRSEVNVHASFTVPGRSDVEKLHLENKVKVERDLKRFVGKEITANFKGHGETKVKVVKMYHLMEPKDICDKLSIEVSVKGEVSYTATIQENYDYYEDDDVTKTDEAQEPRSDIEWFDIRTRRRRQVNDQQIADQFVVYEVCVQHSPSYNLTGMTIVDITLLSGFVATAEDLEALKSPPEQYISHFELSQGKVLIYLDQLLEQKQCFEFRAKQLYTVGLLQPAPAVFYDYYEPNQKCTVFYSAPKRSKVVSKLCSEDVCQCAERPCHKLQNTFDQNEEDGQIRKTSERRQDHACFYPIVDYAYMATVSEVSEKNNFELYKATVTDVLKMRGDPAVKTGSHRVFAKRRQCRSRLEVGTEYLIMGKDGSTTDSHGQMQYLLEVSTWVEPRPLNCEKTAHKDGCNEFNKFVEEFKVSSCKQ